MQRTEYFSVPEKMTLSVVQMGKCMATCVPCVKFSSEYGVLECKERRELADKLIEPTSTIDGETEAQGNRVELSYTEALGNRAGSKYSELRIPSCANSRFSLLPKFPR